MDAVSAAPASSVVNRTASNWLVADLRKRFPLCQLDVELADLGDGSASSLRVHVVYVGDRTPVNGVLRLRSFVAMPSDGPNPTRSQSDRAAHTEEDLDVALLRLAGTCDQGGTMVPETAVRDRYLVVVDASGSCVYQQLWYHAGV